VNRKDEYESKWKGERGVVLNIEDHNGMLVKRYDFANLFNHMGLVLDLGCGSGFGSEILAKKAWRVDAIDKTAEAVDFGKRYHSKGNIEWFVESFPPILKKEKTYDLVACHEVVEHIEDDNAFIGEIKRILKDNGTLCMTTPIAKDKPPAKWHYREYSREEFGTLLKKHFTDVFIIYFDHNKHMAVCRK